MIEWTDEELEILLEALAKNIKRYTCQDILMVLMTINQSKTVKEFIENFNYWNQFICEKIIPRYSPKGFEKDYENKSRNRT